MESLKENENINHKGHKLKYQNLILLFISIIVATYLLIFRPVATTIINLGLEQFGYVAAFIYGVMYAYAITIAPATVLIYSLGTLRIFEPLLIAAVGAVGAMISNYLIFKFVRDSLMDEIRQLERDVGGFIHNLDKNHPNFANNHHLLERARIWKTISNSAVWKAIVPVIAGLIIASPLPDEFGAAIFGAIGFNVKKFVVLSLFLNFIGILAISYLGSL